MTLRDLLTEGEHALQSAGIEDWKMDAWYLMEEMLHVSRTRYLMEPSKEVSPEEEMLYKKQIARRAKHIPLQHLTGHQEFMGLDFQVSEDVLVPRQDTEILVEEALKYVHSGMKLLDMCTGSGRILLSIVKLTAELNGCKEVTGTGVDLSEKALKIAQENRRTLGMEQTTALLQSDLFEQVNGTYDMIVSNPPYIASEVITTLSEEVKDHEPVMALDGGTDGLDFYRVIIEKSPAYLAPKGMLFFEIGYDQGVSVSRLMEKDFKDIHVIKDLAGLDRVVYGTLKA